MTRERPYFGPAVTADRDLRYTSVSSIQSFDEEGTDGGCQRKWWGTKVGGWEDPGSVAQERGVKFHAEVEHYYLTGEDVRGPVMRSGAHLLPRRGPDIFIEQAFGAAVEEEYIRGRLLVESDPLKIESMRRRLAWVEGQLRLPGGTVPLLAGGVPLVGFIDMRHQRGEYVDESGVLRQEEVSGVVEPLDHKTTSSIKDWAKSGTAIANTVQMVGYGVRVAGIVPEIRYVRPSHVYYQTRGALTAKKSTLLVPVADILAKWRRVDALVDEMRHVARKGAVEDVRPNFNACSTFGGCPHQEYCPRAERTIYHVLGISGDTMSNGLFGSICSPSQPPIFPVPSPPPLSEAERQVKIAEATARFRAEDAGMRSCGAPGCDAGFVAGVPCAACRGQGIAGLASVLPPGTPPSTILEDALPLPPEEIARIRDPALRARVEEHARRAAETRARADAEKVISPKTSGNCSGGKVKVAFVGPVKTRGNKVACAVCGKQLPVKPAADGTAVVPGHRMPEAASVPPPAGPPPLPAMASPPLLLDVPPLPAGVPCKRLDLVIGKSRSEREVVTLRTLDGAVPELQDLLTAAGFAVGERVSIVLS